MIAARVLVAALALAAGIAVRAGDSKADCREDVDFALDAVARECRELLRVKDIDWKKVGRRFRKEAKKVRSEEDEYLLLCRLVAALHDGHATVKAPDEIRKAVRFPFDLEAGPGVFLCRVKDDVYVKNAWSGAAASGVEPGMRVREIEGEPALDWLLERAASLGEYLSFSTDQQAFYFACHWGLGGPKGSTLKLELESTKGRRKKATVGRGRASTVPSGPAVLPEGLERVGRQHYGTLPSGYGYIHLRDTPGEILAQMDEMLAKIGEVPGLILDFRANGGGGFDHDALLGRFVPKGRSMKRAHAGPIASAGATPYGGPVVVIVDAGCRSAGETGSGMFKEDGRAYMIGESPTAGMSSSKTTIPLPSGRFSLYVSVHSNKARFQGGKGIEGIGIVPHEIVPYDPEDLAQGRDTLIRRAEAILADFPAKEVPYKPEDYGWGAD
jgi:hypothetical protein